MKHLVWPFWRKPKKYVRLFDKGTGELLIIGGDVEPNRCAKIMVAFWPDHNWDELNDQIRSRGREDLT